jgi:C1A family cysteine protease
MTVLKGHAALATGYNRDKRLFRIRNSWGPNANDGCYFDLDYDYLLNSSWAQDFWVIYETFGLI